MRRISSGKARKGMTRSQARSQTGEGGGARLAVGPGGGELIEHLAGGVSVGCGVDPAQLAGAALAFSPGEIAQALADEVDDAGLVDRLREDGVDRLRETGEAVGADEEHVLDAAVAKLGHDARPEAGALGLLDPEAETVTLAFEGDPDRDVDGLLADDLLVADRDLHRVQADGHVQLLERPALPGADVVLDRRGHLADQSIGDVDAVQLAQVPLDLAGRHPAGIQREDLIVEAVEGAGVLGHHLRLERGVAVARQLDRDRPVDGSQRLRRHPVAPVRLSVGRIGARPVAEVLLQLDAGGTLDQPLAQLVDQSVRAGQLLRPPVLAEQLIDQLVRDLHVAHQCVSFRAARRNRSDRGYAAIVPTPSDEPVRYTEIRALPRQSALPRGAGASRRPYIEVGSRRVHLAGCTTNPTGAWVTQQARSLSFTGVFERMRFLIHDRDSKFSAAFDEVFRSEGIKVIHTPIRAPQANAYAERFVRT